MAEGLEEWFYHNIWKDSKKIILESEHEKENDPLLNALAWIKGIVSTFQTLDEGYESTFSLCDQGEALRKMELYWDNFDLEKRTAAWMDLLEAHNIQSTYAFLNEPPEFDNLILDIQLRNKVLWQNLLADEALLFSLLAKSMDLIPHPFAIFFALDFCYHFEKNGNMFEHLFLFNIDQLLAKQNVVKLDEEAENEQISNDEKVVVLIQKAIRWNRALDTPSGNKDIKRQQSQNLAMIFILWVRKLSENWTVSEDCADSREELEQYLIKEKLKDDKNFCSGLTATEQAHLLQLKKEQEW